MHDRLQVPDAESVVAAWLARNASGTHSHHTLRLFADELAERRSRQRLQRDEDVEAVCCKLTDLLMRAAETAPAADGVQLLQRLAAPRRNLDQLAALPIPMQVFVLFLAESYRLPYEAARLCVLCGYAVATTVPPVHSDAVQRHYRARMCADMTARACMPVLQAHGPRRTIAALHEHFEDCSAIDPADLDES